MSDLALLLKQLGPVLKDGYSHGFSEDKVEDIIVKHSIASAAAGLAAGFLPGVGAIIAAITGSGAIWTMYYRICQEMQIPLSKNILKALGSAILSNIITQLGGVLALELIASFIPGIAIIANAAACYGITYLAGFLFIKLLVNLFKAGKNPAAMSADELSSAGKAASQETNCADIFKNARDEAKTKIRNGEITKDDQL